MGENLHPVPRTALFEGSSMKSRRMDGETTFAEAMDRAIGLRRPMMPSIKKMHENYIAASERAGRSFAVMSDLMVTFKGEGLVLGLACGVGGVGGGVGVVRDVEVVLKYVGVRPYF